MCFGRAGRNFEVSQKGGRKRLAPGSAEPAGSWNWPGDHYLRPGEERWLWEFHMAWGNTPSPWEGCLCFRLQPQFCMVSLLLFGGDLPVVSVYKPLESKVTVHLQHWLDNFRCFFRGSETEYAINNSISLQIPQNTLVILIFAYWVLQWDFRANVNLGQINLALPVFR